MENLPKSEILKSDISDMFSSYLKDLTQSCESEIEKQLLLCFVKYIFNDIYFSGPYTIYAGIQNARDFNDWKFTSISQIYDCQERIHMSIDKLNELKSKGYKEYTSDLVKSVGITFKDEHDFSNSYSIYKLMPQYNIKLEKFYRLDFALLVSHFKDRSLIKESKIAIECDGFEYHSSKHHLNRDNQRNRALQLNEWKVYRMSGSEIYSINSIEMIKSIFNDMRTFSH